MVGRMGGDMLADTSELLHRSFLASIFDNYYSYPRLIKAHHQSFRHPHLQFEAHGWPVT